MDLFRLQERARCWSLGENKTLWIQLRCAFESIICYYESGLENALPPPPLSPLPHLHYSFLCFNIMFPLLALSIPLCRLFLLLHAYYSIVLYYHDFCFDIVSVFFTIYSFPLSFYQYPFQLSILNLLYVSLVFFLYFLLHCAFCYSSLILDIYIYYSVVFFIIVSSLLPLILLHCTSFAHHLVLLLTPFHFSTPSYFHFNSPVFFSPLLSWQKSLPIFLWTI